MANLLDQIKLLSKQDFEATHGNCQCWRQLLAMQSGGTSIFVDGMIITWMVIEKNDYGGETAGERLRIFLNFLFLLCYKHECKLKWEMRNKSLQSPRGGKICRYTIDKLVFGSKIGGISYAIPVSTIMINATCTL